MLRSAFALVLAGSLAFTGAPPSPGEVIVDQVDGLQILDERLDLDFESYATWAPELVDHVDPASEEAAGMQGAYRIWGGDGIDGVIVNITVWPDVHGAARYVDQAAREAAGLGLKAHDRPFGDVLMFDGDGPDGAFVTYLTWRHEHYGVAMVAVGESLADAVVATARAQQEALQTVGPDIRSDAGTDTGGGGTPIVSVLVLAAIAAGSLWLYRHARRDVRARPGR